VTVQLPTAPRRVALVLGPSSAGIGRHVHSLVAGLHARGVAVDLYCPAPISTEFDFASAGARVTTIDVPASPGPRDVGVVSQLRRALRAEPVDLVHAHGLRAGFLAAIARPGDTPLVVSWHQTFGAHPLARLASRGIARTVAAAAEVSLCASPELLRTATRLGAKDARLCLVPAPVLPGPQRDGAEVREEFGLAAATPLVLAVGRLHSEERHEILVAAAAMWRERRLAIAPGEKQPTPTVLIEGTGPAYRDLAARIITSRAPVILVGHRDDLSDLLHAADLAVILRDGESQQGFAQEALASGVPLVVAEHGGLAEIVGDAALLVAPADAEALDAAVRSLLDDADRRAGLAAAGLARAGTWPTDDDCVAAVAAAYSDLLSPNRIIDQPAGSPRPETEATVDPVA
jgi:glycosyltransferase involved in cell wall biosynthesis